MVEEGCARLEAHGHAGPVYLHQNVTWKVALDVVHLHPVGEGQIFPCEDLLPPQERVVAVGRVWLEAAPSELPAEQTQCPLDVVTVLAASSDSLESAPPSKAVWPVRRETREDRPPGPFGCPGFGNLIERVHVPVVATEHFIASVARQGDCHLGPGQLAHEKCRQCRAVGKRLVV